MHRVLKLGGKVGHVTRHAGQLFKVKRSKVQGHAQEIYAIAERFVLAGYYHVQSWYCMDLGR